MTGIWTASPARRARPARRWTWTRCATSTSAIVVETAEWQDRIARETLRRQPVHVMLMHETDLEALFLPDAVRALRARGWRIATMDEAYRDPIARVVPETRYLGGGRVAAIAAAAGRLPSELAPPLNEEAEILRLFNAQVLHQGTAP